MNSIKKAMEKIEGEVTASTVLEQCIMMSQDKNFDAFFNYSGHIDSINVYVNYKTSYGIKDKANKIYDKWHYCSQQELGASLAEIYQDLIGIEYEAEQKSSALLEERLS